MSTVFRLNGRAVSRAEFLRDARGVAPHGTRQHAGDVERRLYGSAQQGVRDIGLGCKTYGRSDRKRKIAERSRQSGKKIECVG